MKSSPKYEYLIANKNTGMYLRYIQDFKHYVADPKDASTFTLAEAKKIIKSYNFPEKWEIVRRRKIEILRNISQKNKRKKVVKERNRKNERKSRINSC